MKLNLGCGKDIIADAVNVDCYSYDDNIMLCDLSCFPWPWDDNTVDEVYAHMFLEHVSNLVETMNEIHRICKDGALLHLTVPYWTGPNTWDDPTHTRAFTSQTFHWFTPQPSKSVYVAAQSNRNQWRVLCSRIQVSAALPFLDLIPRILGPLYERFFAHLIPAQGLAVDMQVIKTHN
jgi:SAM-dependent methyltransferase